MSLTVVSSNTHKPGSPTENASTVRKAAGLGQVVGWQEANDTATMAAIRGLPGWSEWVGPKTANQNVISWQDKACVLDARGSVVLYKGGKGDGPDRCLNWSLLWEIATGKLFWVFDLHEIAKAFSDNRDRLPEWNQILDGAAAAIGKLMAGRPGAPAVIMGDFNAPTRKKIDFLGIGEREVKSPGTFGKNRYDRFFLIGDITMASVRAVDTASDHDALVGTITLGAKVPVVARPAHPVNPTPKPPEQPEPSRPVARVEAALARAERQSKNGPKFKAGMCKQESRELYLVPSDGSPDASTSWARADFKHPIGKTAAIPRGVFIWWTGGGDGHGHVAVSAGGGKCWSVDFKRTGFWDLVDIDAIAKKWTKLKLVGWSEDIDGVRVVTASEVPVPSKPSVPARMNPANYFLGANGPWVTWLGQRLVLHGYGQFYKDGPGPKFTAADRNAVKVFQRAQGWSGSDADGFPGRTTLQLLAKAPTAAPVKPTPLFKADADGTDISHHQAQAIDWARAIAAGLQFAYFKVSEGETFLDSRYAARRAEAAKVKLPTGGYHFGRPDMSTGDARDEAGFFLEHLKPKAGDMLPVLDLEDRAGVAKFKIDRAELTDWVHDWVMEVKRQRGVLPLLYNVFDLNDTFGCPLWVPRYNNAMKPPVVPKPWKTWAVWQFSNGVDGRPNSIPGIGHVDINTLNRGVSIEQLRIPAKKAA